LKTAEYTRHQFVFNYQKEQANTYCYKFGGIELRKFYFERYFHISSGIRNYFFPQLKTDSPLPIMEVDGIKSIDD
jgi:hypothetical protein